MGIGMGWPNASAQNAPVLRTGWFNVISTCNFPGVILVDNYTNEQIGVDWVEGDYVYYPDGQYRVLLGPFQDTVPVNPQKILNVVGPTYNSCGI